MFRKSITRISIVAALALAALGATATAALADSGTTYFGPNLSGQVSVSDALCNRYTHRATFQTSVLQPKEYPNGIWFSEVVYAKDATVGGQWQSTGQVTRFVNGTTWGSGGTYYVQPVDFSNTNFPGVAGHYYRFMVGYTWALPGGSWQNWQYFNVDPFTWIYANGQRLSGNLYCSL
jgi:hypothetical protein